MISPPARATSRRRYMAGSRAASARSGTRAARAKVRNNDQREDEQCAEAFTGDLPRERVG
jgi:hypothetical protein